MITMVILLTLLIVFVIIGVPLAFAIGAACITYLLSNPLLLQMLPQRIWNGAYSDLMIAMPLFMLAGDIMSSGGLTKRIISFCKQILRPIHGGLGEVNIVDSMIFGGISGSSVADTSALGSIIIPAMEADGYPRKVAAGITVASSTMGMIIPPSTPMIVYSMISGASVGALFLAGAIPGILVGLCQLAFVVFMSVKNHWHPEREKFNAKEFWKDILGGVPAILMPLFIILVVSTGICTASESAGAAVFSSFDPIECLAFEKAKGSEKSKRPCTGIERTRVGHMARTPWRYPSPARIHRKLLMPAPTRDRPGRVGVFSCRGRVCRADSGPARAHIRKCRQSGESLETGKGKDKNGGPPQRPATDRSKGKRPTSGGRAESP